MTSTADDPIVVVGIGIEAPGGIETLTEFWSALAGSQELIGPFPRDRGWPLRQLFSLGAEEGWSDVPDAGGFLAGATEFDPLFFGITPREAVAMDPQQRVALRVAWRALENAGLNPGALDGEPAGCWMGVSITEYGPRAAGVNDYSGYRVTGTALGAVAGRISHGLGLIGPSVSVDTACASSLTAVHQAAAAIRSGECEWALAGAVCVMGTPGAFFEFSKNSALAADGHCRSYAADASGTLWGEGAGVLVLERESRARAHGHYVYGRLLGSRVNHNGKGAPIAVPSADAQERLIRATLDAAGIAPELVGLIEGHGTGTPVGDPLELTALARTYGSAPGANPKLGSVKSNVGHAQAASGVLGLIKVLLCGEHGHIAPSLWADNPTAELDWSATGLRLASKYEQWEPVDGVRYAAVSSFGVAGTNAHAVIGMPVTDDATTQERINA
ncbi:polyketide synthase [Nocardia donostiensis]|uniref:Polyketide synthase n=1 Tax=Nocardia donostiensis TaxID=1538463 RepID=A0A1V2TMK6_9NOCA|nr:polyketide synthase [Nocardia donostiensis]ONM50754.1 polyketide synthase [Nocardia donostiensis]OQS17451.1 polyketide synthase [Nocardia donostiensis]OQS18895.1 polyketide synthase [Nocardia donostiensis]